MDSNKDNKESDSETSRFEVDGVVAEMMIEVDEEETLSPSKVVAANKTMMTSPLSKETLSTVDIDKISDGTENESSLKRTDDSSTDCSDEKGMNATKNASENKMVEDGDLAENAKTLESNEKEFPDTSISDSDKNQKSELLEPDKPLSPEKAEANFKKTKESVKVPKSKTSQEKSTRIKSVFQETASECEKRKGILKNPMKTEAVKSAVSKVKLEIPDEELDAEEANQRPRRGRKRNLSPDKPMENLPNRKPRSIVPAKLRPYNLYPKGTSKLESFIEVKRELKTADLKHVKALYRLMFDKLPHRSIEDLNNEILQFQGFTFNKRSDELEKRQKSLKKLPDSMVSKICQILDLKEGTKDDMISDIIKFLLKPIKIVFSVVDPFQPNLQPVVKLDRLSMDDTRTTPPKMAVKTSKRKRMPSTRLSEYVSDIPHMKSEVITESDEEKDSSDSSKKERKRGRPRKKILLSDKDLSSSKKRIEVGQKAGEKSKAHLKPSKMSTHSKKVKNENRTELQNFLASKAKPSTRKRKAETSSPNESTSSLVSSPQDDDSSETTLSSDEAKREEAKIAVRRKKTLLRREGKPLTTFPKVKENIMKANYSALQRIHILLFGSSDKVENLKANILAFGGFPFLEGSEEWKQKEFLCSLLAPNTLKEYLNLLCIEHHSDHDNQTLISKLMKFLAVPKENTSDELFTQVVSSEPVIQTPGDVPVENSYSLRLRTTPSPLNKSRTSGNLEEKKGTSQKATVKDLKDLKTSVKYCQANYCSNNSRENPELSYFSYPNDPIRLEKWLTNIELKPTSKRYNLCLCSKHFDCRAFTNTYKNARLLSFAVPTIPAPGSTRKIVYPCLDGYASPSSSKLVYETPGDKSETPTTSQSPSDTSRVPLQKLMDDLTQKRTSVTTPQTDSELLDALLQTVYKRRALKEAGAKVSIPNKGTHTRLGELDNVKFLVVTSNYNDLDVLHHLIYMSDAGKGKVRKNIMDFAGFNFVEDSSPYKDRMAFLQSLGYNISKRIAFLLGLCPYKLDIDQQDLNELIMYFLMSPCKSKQIPIRHLPQNFFTTGMPQELCSLLEKHGETDSSTTKSLPDTVPPSEDKGENIPLPEVQSCQKAKKSFRSSTSSLKATSALKKTDTAEQAKKPLGIGEKATSLSSTLLKPSSVSTTTIKPSSVPATIPQSLLKGPPGDMGPQEFLVQQQTPDGQQKTFKLIRLPTTHPLNTAPAAKNPQQSLLRPPVPIPGAPLPPGIILFKNSPLRGAIVSPGGYMSPMNPSGITSKLASTGIIPPTGAPEPRIVNQTTPVIPLGSPVVKAPATPKVSASSESKTTESNDPPLEFDYEEVEVLNPLADNEPTDDDLYNSIQEIIHNSNFEDITLRNVIDRVSAQYAAFDLKKRHGYMKECVKKIIIGT